MRSCHLARVTSSEDVSSLLLVQMLSSCWLLMLQRAKQSRSHQRVDPFVDPGDQAALIINPARAQSISHSLPVCTYYARIRSAIWNCTRSAALIGDFGILHTGIGARKRRNEMETRLRQLVQANSQPHFRQANSPVAHAAAWNDWFSAWAMLKLIWPRFCSHRRVADFCICWWYS
jgi:hypothetical protein